MPTHRIRPSTGAADYPALVAIWESAVKATHDFLDPADFEQIKKHLASDYFPAVELTVAEGDESALPAILAILEGQTSQSLPTEVFLEVPTEDDIRPAFKTPAGTNLHWLPRNTDSMKPGTLALQAVKEANLPDGDFYTWTAGESSLPTGVRRHLVNDRGVPKTQIDFTGYWRQGRASFG